jgi:5-methylcytosine-specific restriction endonuclease McrA
MPAPGAAVHAMLNTNVLVLNNLYQAIQITSVRRAMCLLYKGHVKVVDEGFATYDFDNWRDLPVGSNDDRLQMPSSTIRVPRVVLLVHYDRLPRYDVRFTRKNIFYRDRNRCQYCGRRNRTRDLNLDHVTPLSRGGRSTWDIVVCCCLRCNMIKGNRLPAEAGMSLVREPARPRWHPLARVRLSNRRYEIWRNFLDAAYWNVELDHPDGEDDGLDGEVSPEQPES